ncbi:hypothetical protein L1987_70065 [Smallanthus sonchifolius]|uniref:Uncharacterized protein n=1 Tax=Smallanthus sonchifolius TaxID=185202 RepID=A0ACB9AMY4_9ASTR|nr:hypothetical protein L1987_70065 [Smallanthus sonchifolius]
MEGNGGAQLDGKVLQTFQRSFVQVQSILDQNRLLINEINQNHESKIPDNLSRNVGLIRELNNNMKKVANLYTDLSSNFSKSIDVNSSEGDSRSDGKGVQKRTRPVQQQSGGRYCLLCSGLSTKSQSPEIITRML